MATGGRLSRSKMNASDELVDFACSPCTKKNKTSDAVKYCVECQEYLCSSCVENHSSFSALTGHSLLGRSLFGTSSRAGGGSLPSVPTERCKIHTTKLVDMYCGNHDRVGCSVCFNIDHKLCDAIHYIPEYVETQKLPSENSHVWSEIKKNMQKLDSLAKQQEKNRSNLNKKKRLCLQEIETFRTEINKTIDRLEQTTIKEIDDQHKTLDQMFDDEIKNIRKTLDELKKLSACVESSDVNISQQFVSAKLCREEIREAEYLISRSLSIDANVLRFEKHSDILDYFSSLQSLDQRQCLPDVKTLRHAGSKENLYEVQTRVSFNMRLPESDSTKSAVWSMCIIDSGDVLISDNENPILKQINGITYKIRNTLKLSTTSCSVSKVNASEVVVCLSDKRIQFVSTVVNLVQTRCLKMDHDCVGACVINSMLFITGGQNRKIYIHDLNGRLLNTIAGDKIFSWNRCIVESDDENGLYVTDRDEGLIKMDKNGKVLWKYSGKTLKSASRVCTDGHGNVFVSGYGSHNILQIASDGRFLGEVIPFNTCIGRAICFDKQKSMLFVAGDRSFDINVYSLK